MPASRHTHSLLPSQQQQQWFFQNSCNLSVFLAGPELGADQLQE
jgi:hypothetical protein